jgi:hypothetical protein
MIEAFLRIALDEKSELHRIVSLSIKVLLSLIVSTKLYGLWLGQEWIKHLPDIDKFLQWVTSGEIVIGIGIYFAVWYIFYAFLPAIILIITFKLGNKLDKFFGILPILKDTPADQLTWKKYIPFLKGMGVINIVNNLLQPGWLILDIAKDLKKSEEKNDEKPVFRPSTEPSVVLHFAITAGMVKSVWFLPCGIIVLGIFIITLIFFFGVVGMILKFIIRKYHNQILSLAERKQYDFIAGGA